MKPARHRWLSLPQICPSLATPPPSRHPSLSISRAVLSLVSAMGIHKRFDEDGKEVSVEKCVSSDARKPTGVSSRVISKPGRGDHKLHGGKKSKTKSIRGQIRSIERLLKNKGSQLTPGAHKAKEEELKELIRLRNEHDRRETEREMATKYRMVKFFERRKLQRTLDKIIEHGDKPDDAEKKKRILTDLRYVTEYPKDKKYIALFPSGGHTDESRSRVEEMRKEIESKADGKGSKDPSGADVPADGIEFTREDDFFLNDDPV